MNPDYLVGRVIGNRYEILEIIGTGGMATVYKAKCRVLNRYVAIKVLKDSLKYDSDVVKKFNAESRAAARLSHPNIVQIYDVGENGEFDYIVMEYVDGVTLKEYIQKKGRLPWEEACDFAIQVGRALDCAHANHVVHRDIKPHNMLLTKDGTLKVADFGIAQAASSETLVAGSGGIGSVHYISPEQARGGYTDERSDVYSLGVVLYEMLTGTVPFDGANPVSIALMKLEQDPKDCRIINPDIPDNVAEITMKAISREQHARYQSAAEFVRELESVCGNGGVMFDYDSSDKFETKRIDDRETKNELYSRRSEKRKHQQNKKKEVIAAVLGVIVIAFLTYFIMAGGPKEYQVPDLTDKTLEEAEQMLEEAQLKLSDEVEFEASEEFEEGHIIRQKPGANQYVKKGRKIKVTLSSGLEDGQIEVPDVENLKYEDAEKRLKAAKLTCKKVEKYDDTIQYGYVISQSPKSGQKVSEGYSVILYVSADIEDPDEQAVVPKLTGHTESQAKLLLEQAGLAPGKIDTIENAAEAGTVISQTPSAKTGVEKGSKVDFTVSTGIAATPTPTPTPAPVLKRKTLTITIPEDAGDTVHIRAVANGKTIYEANHAKSEGAVDITVQGSKDANVQVYIDGKQVADKVITFD
ncbi:MAG: Stk1 family PASTA domain-containing Ser/Thr kinase [Clostridiales bacterium]|nr:Stk1 family PASTA domain-containing Ser/Thr kinase [Clostridiales bacterium]